MEDKQSKVTSEWNEYAKDWDAMASGYRDSFVKLLEVNESMIVLDFGCGTGLLTEALQDKVQKVVCMDASPNMIEKVKEKITSRSWSNVEAFTAVLSELEHQPPDVKQAVDDLKGKVDLIVASSVLSFIPDIESTMRVLGDMATSGGVLVHSDWPKDFTKESATKMYASGGMVPKSMEVIDLTMGEEKHPVFFGVATKKE